MTTAVQPGAVRDCAELVGWYLFANLRQEFDYSLYPLDTQDVWLRMWHQDFRDNVILVPELSAYSLLDPQQLPGVQQGFVLPGWDINESWFSYRDLTFNTNFGQSTSAGLIKKPELFYNIEIHRQFLDPFVSRIIPVILVALLLFMIVLINTKTNRVAQWLGFSANSVVLGLSGLFFVVAINHSDLRQTLNSSGIMYFEHFYFVIYIMLLYVAASAIYIATSEESDGREDNFITKILYWPILSLALFTVTFQVFF